MELTSEGGVVDLEGEVDDGVLVRSEAVADVEEMEGVGKRMMGEPGESFGDGGDLE